MKSQSDSFRVKLLRRFEEAKKLKQFTFVFFLDADSIVSNGYLNHSVLSFFIKMEVFRVVEVIETSDIFALDLDVATFGSELKSIWLEIKKNLLYPLHVTADE